LPCTSSRSSRASTANGSSFPGSAITRAVFKIACVAAALAIVWNAQAIALAGIHGYQRSLSPLAARVGLRCRFMPTCSTYAETVIERDGALRGGWKALTRIARCNPLTPAGTRDDP
jgi:putative membrane protein insertion efficiency factor